MDEVGTRERILRIASRLFYQQGYQGTSLDEIAKQVGIRKASLYHHFASKQELLDETLKDCIEPVYRTLVSIQTSDEPAAEKLRWAVISSVCEIIQNTQAVAIFLHEVRVLPPEQVRGFAQYRDAFSRLFASILEEGQRSGEFAISDVQHAKLALLGMLNWVAFWYRSDGPSPPEAIARDFAELALRAVGHQAGTTNGSQNPPPRGGSAAQGDLRRTKEAEG